MSAERGQGQGDEPDLDGEAAEYVLGTLDRAERRAADRRRLSDPDFAAAVDAWERRLAPIDASLPAVMPPPHVWQAIETRTGAAPVPSLATPDLGARLRRWRAATALASLAAIILGGLVLRDLALPPQAPISSYVAVLGGEAGAPAFVASVDTAAGTIRLRRVGMAPPEGRSYELWKVPASGPTVSLGTADDERQLKPLAVGLKAGERLAISVEPKGGSPTGQATGPVVYIGTLLPAE